MPLPVITRRPAPNAIGPTQPDDPQTALAQLLGLSDMPSSGVDGPMYSPTAKQAGDTLISRTHLLDEEKQNLEWAKKDPRHFATGSTDTSVASLEGDIANDPNTGVAAHAAIDKNQQLADFLSPYQEQQRGEEQKNKMALAKAPAEATAQGNMAVEAMKAHAAEDVARINASKGSLGGGGFESDNSEVSYAADQVQHDPSMMSKLGLSPVAKQQVLSELSMRGVDLDLLTNQAKARAQASTTMLLPGPTGLSTFDEIRQMGHQLEAAGMFAPGVGLVRQFMSRHGLGNNLIGQFESRLGLAISQLQNIHAGARGAASTDLRKAFEALINAKGNPETFAGQLDSAEELIRGYANENAPVRGGVRQRVGAPDPYADPNWGKQ